MTQKQIKKFFLDAGWSLYEPGHIIYHYYPNSVAYNYGDTDAIITKNDKLIIENDTCCIKSTYSLVGLLLDRNGDIVNGKLTLKIEHQTW